MLTRCGMLLHSFPMQRRLTWSHPPKAAAFFFPFSFFGFTMSELYESMPTNNGRWRLYHHPCMVRIMQSGEFRRWWSTRQILYMPIIPWKKKLFLYNLQSISLCGKATACMTWKENSYAGMSSSAAYPAHLLTRYDLSWLIADQIRIRCTLIWSAFVGWPLAAGRPIFFVYRNCVEA